MATWKKYFTTVPSQAKMTAKLEQMNREAAKAGTSHKFSSYLPEVYAGAPNRIERYVAYDQADLDSEINRALDTIAEFCTQNQDDDNPIPFRIIYRGDVTETETELLTSALQQWNSINKFNQRIFRIFRNSIKYGDQFFIRDPETYELLWVDATKVEKIMVNEAEGKKIDQYVIKDLDFNMESMVATNPLVHDQYSFPGGYPRSSNPASGSGNINYGQPSTPGSRTSRFYNPASSMPVDAAHVVHLSLTDGMDQNWPFGISILEAIYKTYKQKDLLEDCILIYRIVRAPERRVFYIDVGQLQGQRAMQYVERVKNEIYQRRLPSKSGGGSGGSVVDTSYNPISMTEDFFLATNNEQRGTKIENLAGGENLGCFSLDTKIKLLDGRDLSISDIEQEMLTGKQLWTFSCHPVTGEIAPGKITWAGKTRSNAQVLCLTLDTGETITCTQDHKFPIHGVGFVEAKDLTVGQSLISLYTNKDMFYDHNGDKWEFIHTMIESFSAEIDKPEFLESSTVYTGNVVNHTVAKIEYLSEPMDVGTLTVDGDEEYHDYHTYALSVGVFVKNSLDDLHYFNNKLLRGLGIPSSYLPSGPEDGTVSYNDGKIGTAFIQEYRFNKYCQRLQSHFSPTFDLEFKLFLKNRGIEVHSSLFELAFNVPQSFSEYRQMALDAERANLFSQVMGSDAAKYMSKRFALEKYLGLTQEEILENEKMWKEENSDKVKAKTGVAPAENSSVGLGSIGIRPESGPDFGDEIPNEETPTGEEPTTETPDLGGGGGPAPAPETPPQSP